MRIASILGIIEVGLFWINEYMANSIVIRAIVGGQIVETRSINTGVFGLGWTNGPLALAAALIMMWIILIIIGCPGLKYSIAGYLNKYEIMKKNKIIQLLVK